MGSTDRFLIFSIQKKFEVFIDFHINILCVKLRVFFKQLDFTFDCLYFCVEDALIMNKWGSSFILSTFQS